VPLIHQPLNTTENLRKVIASIQPGQKLTAPLTMIGSKSANLLCVWMQRSEDAQITEVENTRRGKSTRPSKWRIDGIFFHLAVEAALRGDNLLQGHGTIEFEGHIYRDCALTRDLISKLQNQRQSIPRPPDGKPVLTKIPRSKSMTDSVTSPDVTENPSIASPVRAQEVPQPRPGYASARFDSEQIGPGTPALGGYRVR
jgi:hypothetical protein